MDKSKRFLKKPEHKATSSEDEDGEDDGEEEDEEMIWKFNDAYQEPGVDSPYTTVPFLPEGHRRKNRGSGKYSTMPPLKRSQSTSHQVDSTPISGAAGSGCGVGDRNSLHVSAASQSRSEPSSSLKKDPATGGSLPDIMIRENSRNKNSATSGDGVGSGSKSIWYIGDNKRNSGGSMFPVSPKGRAAPLARREVSINII